MDARIGKLIREGNEVFYAFVNSEYTEGTLHAIEFALGLRSDAKTVEVVAEEVAAPVTTRPGLKEFTVHVQKKHPAWDEIDGYDVVVWATSKADANRMVRDDERRNCVHCGDGAVYYKATAN